MQIRKDSWHAKLWRFGHLWSREVPVRTSLCSYFWNITIGVPLMVMFVILVVSAYTAFYLVIQSLLLATGVGIWNPATPWKTSQTHREWVFFWVPWRWRGKRIRLWRILAPLYASALVCWLVCLLPWAEFAKMVNHFKIRHAMPILSVMTGIALYNLWNRFSKSEFHALLKAWGKARKQKVCPLIEFVD